MHTARSSSRLLGGGLPQCILGYPPGVGLEIPLGVGLETPQVWACRHALGVGLETPPGVGLETPPSRPDPSTSPLGVGLETCKACWDTTCNACWDTTTPAPVYRILDIRYWKYYLAPNAGGKNDSRYQMHIRKIENDGTKATKKMMLN